MRRTDTDHPTETVIVTDQAEIPRRDLLFTAFCVLHAGPGLPKLQRQREVVVHAGNGLHQRAVAILQPFAVQRLHAADVRRTKLRQLDILLGFDKARHAERPHALIADIARHVTMNITQERQQVIDVVINRRNEL